MLRCVQGRVKAVTENRTGMPLEPTPHYDCHVAKNSQDVGSSFPQQLHDLSQVSIACSNIHVFSLIHFYFRGKKVIRKYFLGTFLAKKEQVGKRKLFLIG